MCQSFFATAVTEGMSTAMASLDLSATKLVTHLPLRISEVRNEVLQSLGLRRHCRRSLVDASSYKGAAVSLGPRRSADNEEERAASAGKSWAFL